MKDTQKSQLISTDLRQIAEQAKQEPAMVFTSLAHHMDIDFLTEAYHRVRKDGPYMTLIILIISDSSMR